VLKSRISSLTDYFTAESVSYCTGTKPSCKSIDRFTVLYCIATRNFVVRGLWAEFDLFLFDVILEKLKTIPLSFKNGKG
jgi:hypothetical protein